MDTRVVCRDSFFLFIVMNLAILMSPLLEGARADEGMTALKLGKSRGALEALAGIGALNLELNLEKVSAMKLLMRGSAKSALKAEQLIAGDEIITSRFQQEFDGLEVIGGFALHQRRVGEASLLGLSMPGTELVLDRTARFDLNTQAGLSESESVAIALSFAAAPGEVRDLAAKPSLKILPSEDRTSAQLIYWVPVAAVADDGAHDLLIDAHTGQVIADLTHRMDFARPRRKPKPVPAPAPTPVPTPKPSPSPTPTPTEPDLAIIEVYDANNASPNDIVLSRYEQVVSNGRASPRADQSAKNALANAQATLKFLRTALGRESYDGKGSSARSLVHMGTSYANAFWDSDLKIMAYGDGDGVTLKDMTLGLDVAGHEMTHGMVSATANLIYMGESGAMNEAIADFFGEMVEGTVRTNDWVMGRELFIDAQGGANGVRNVKDPHAKKASGDKPYPKHYSERFTTTSTCWMGNDNCFVHLNSTIFSHAAYLLTEKVGRAVTQKLIYTTLTQFLTTRSGFREAGSSVRQACQLLNNSNVCSQVDQVLSGVGI
ncbi:MAG: M4 family metallopeptidase [Bacteriovoracia bacterium]